MAPYEIKNPQELLANVLGDSELVNFSVSALTTAGENYGSAIFSVTFTIKDEEEERQIDGVAKMLPRNEFVARLFNSDKTFRNEVGYYEKIFPCLRRYQNEKGFENLIKSCPDFYAARLSLTSSSKVDDDAVLLIKNVKSDGFAIGDRMVGFDLEQSRLILEKMAELHATVMALKLENPDVFDGKLMGFFQEFKMYESDNGDSKDKMITSIIDLVRDDEFCLQNLAKIREAFNESTKFGCIKNSPKLQKSVFTSLVHSDMWTNNIMLKVVDGKTVDVKFIDYQIYEYSSITRDVVFFLFSSVKLDVIRNSSNDLIAFYFESLYRWLAKFGCNMARFKFEDFLEEMASVVKTSEFFHIMLMLRPMFMLEKNAKKMDELKREDFIDKTPELAEGCKPKAAFIVRELMRRGWI